MIKLRVVVTDEEGTVLGVDTVALLDDAEMPDTVEGFDQLEEHHQDVDWFIGIDDQDEMRHAGAVILQGAVQDLVREMNKDSEGTGDQEPV